MSDIIEAIATEADSISTSWHSYPSPKTVGHGMVRDLFLDPVIVEEKLDGSQFSFGIFNGELRLRSKGAQLNVYSPEKMFIKALETVKELAPLLTDGYTYRCEYFQKPKHNALAYDRVPDKHLIIIDINSGHEHYLNYAEKSAEAKRIGLEVTPLLFEGVLTDPLTLRDLLDKVSILGGAKIEGVVVKNYARFTMDGKALMGKFVSEEFKEIHSGEWKKENPGTGDIVSILISKYRSIARWQKAVQHLSEQGKIKQEMSDLQYIMPEVTRDIQAECESEIKDMLFDWAWKSIARSLTGGLPEWYREKLLKDMYGKEETKAEEVTEVKPQVEA